MYEYERDEDGAAVIRCWMCNHPNHPAREHWTKVDDGEGIMLCHLCAGWHRILNVARERKRVLLG